MVKAEAGMEREPVGAVSGVTEGVNSKREFPPLPLRSHALLASSRGCRASVCARRLSDLTARKNCKRVYAPAL